MQKPVATTDHLANRHERLSALRATLASLLSKHKTITLEIGSGHGHFLTGYAAAHPTEFCVGIDIILDRLTRSDRKRTRAGLENLTFVRAEATEFLAVLPQDVKLGKIFVLFPDPWPKRRHHKNRLMQPHFLDALARPALPRAQLCFRTDHDDYFAAATKVLGSHADWAIDPAAIWPFELSTVFQSRAASHRSAIAYRRAAVT